MKNTIFLSGLMMVLLTMSARATLLDDADGIDGTGTGIAGFDDTDVDVSPLGAPGDFAGDVIGDLGIEFTAGFEFYESGGMDYLYLYFEPSSSSGATDTLNFSVTFSDMEWPGTEVLGGIGLDFDGSGLGGAGIAPGVTDSSLTLTFVDFLVPDGFREVNLELITETDSGGGPGTPIPEPATALILGLGAAGLAVRRFAA